jgi:hypothetical protein
VIPVSVISTRVVATWRSHERFSWRELVPWLKDEDFQHWKVIDSDYFLDADAPLSAVVAALVRQSTLLAWVTSADNDELRSRGLAKVMPEGIDDDPHARYSACGIKLVELRTEAAT